MGMIRGRGVALSVRLSAHAEGCRVELPGRVHRDPPVEFIETLSKPSRSVRAGR